MVTLLPFRVAGQAMANQDFAGAILDLKAPARSAKDLTTLSTWQLPSMPDLQ
jgi:hypothetical protein